MVNLILILVALNMVERCFCQPANVDPFKMPFPIITTGPRSSGYADRFHLCPATGALIVVGSSTDALLLATAPSTGMVTMVSGDTYEIKWS